MIWGAPMARVPVGKRKFHAFLSHAHVDKAVADLLFEWLSNVVGAPVWYDSVELPPGATIEEVLPSAIENSRSMILLLSKVSVSRGWVQHEYRAAINHQTRIHE
jgi:TIR domain